ncbi:class I SAM-dependent methyltransferase [Halospeciosus flavus]|uniref:Class I SAM-dependent methyltransferase n=1 Tax=Halospeciosus flavus TaxID=3032283 RepID=A0ABD5Z621_9EURY|nr:methyltransferase domain-containing protein [Halospeciosus flavus]
MSDEVQSFYTRIAPVFDLVARYTPGVGAARRVAAETLALTPGDTVLDVGCGTGANAPTLREQVGASGRVVGVDLTEALLRRARTRGVDVVRGDATRLPVDGPVDGVLATFVVGMFEDPETVVSSWLDCLTEGDRLVVLEATSSDHPFGRVANPLFERFVRTGAPDPQGGRDEREHDAGVRSLLDERVATAERTLRVAEGVTVEKRTRLAGFLTLLVAER